MSDFPSYIVHQPDGTTFGPVDVATLKEWATTGIVTRETAVSIQGEERRIPAVVVPGLDVFFLRRHSQNSGPATDIQRVEGDDSIFTPELDQPSAERCTGKVQDFDGQYGTPNSPNTKEQLLMYLYFLGIAALLSYGIPQTIISKPYFRSGDYNRSPQSLESDSIFRVVLIPHRVASDSGLIGWVVVPVFLVAISWLVPWLIFRRTGGDGRAWGIPFVVAAGVWLALLLFGWRHFP
ncbi:MAG: hypothetical protein J0L72_08630 [Armatimonadetes bacterium]|nr:hypothetical protein [Armatimonadota bacterium]